MHSPETQAFFIENPFYKKDKHGYRPPLLTIWHHDPEKDGTDDSCGWFIRSRHIDKKLLEKVRKEFEYHFKNNYWFNEGGYPKFSASGIALNMYTVASWQIFMYENNGEIDKKKHDKFMRKHLYDILHFAENPFDSISSNINMKFGVEKTEYRIQEFTDIITSDIFRKRRKWYQHPKWHIHHWNLQFHPIQDIKRKYWDKCCICGKRGFKSSAMSDWGGKRLWHQECDNSLKPQPTEI